MNLTDLMNRAYAAPTFQVSNDILAEAAELRSQQARSQAVAATKGLLEHFEGEMIGNVERLRDWRRLEKAQAKKVAALDRALRYFGHSGNPLPVYKAQGMTQNAVHFCRAVGIPIPAPNDAAWEVPEDFVAEAQESE